MAKNNYFSMFFSLMAIKVFWAGNTLNPVYLFSVMLGAIFIVIEGIKYQKAF